VEELSRRWTAYRVDAALAPDDGERLDTLRADLAALRVQVVRVAVASQRAMDAGLASSAAIAERAQWISWAAAGAGLLLSVLLSALTVRSISRGLRRLREGTREVAGG